MDPMFADSLFPVDIVTWVIGALITAGVGWLLTRKREPRLPTQTNALVNKTSSQTNTTTQEQKQEISFPELVLTAFRNWVNQLTSREFVVASILYDGAPAVLLLDQRDSPLQVGISGQENGKFHIIFMSRETPIPTNLHLFPEKPKNLEQMLNLFVFTLNEQLAGLAIFKRTSAIELQIRTICDTFRMLGAADQAYSKLENFVDEDDLYSSAMEIRSYLENLNKTQAENDPSVLDDWTDEQWKIAARGEDFESNN